MVRDLISENLLPKRAIYSVTAAQRSNMGFLGNIFAEFAKNGFLFLREWRIHKR